MFSFLSGHKTRTVSAEESLPGRPAPIEVTSPIATAQKAAVKTTRIMRAGIEAIAHFTMKTIIEPNGMWTSVTTTCCR